MIDLAPGVLQRVESRAYLFKIHTLLGDTHMAMDSPIDAIDSYARARAHAILSEQEVVSDKLLEAIARMKICPWIT